MRSAHLIFKNLFKALWTVGNGIDLLIGWFCRDARDSECVGGTRQ